MMGLYMHELWNAGADRVSSRSKTKRKFARKIRKKQSQSVDEL
jgi:hypothetical protein